MPCLTGHGVTGVYSAILSKKEQIVYSLCRYCIVQTTLSTTQSAAKYGGDTTLLTHQSTKHIPNMLNFVLHWLIFVHLICKTSSFVKRLEFVFKIKPVRNLARLPAVLVLWFRTTGHCPFLRNIYVVKTVVHLIM